MRIAAKWTAALVAVALAGICLFLSVFAAEKGALSGGNSITFQPGVPPLPGSNPQPDTVVVDKLNPGHMPGSAEVPIRTEEGKVLQNMQLSFSGMDFATIIGMISAEGTPPPVPGVPGNPPEAIRLPASVTVTDSRGKTQVIPITGIADGALSKINTDTLIIPESIANIGGQQFVHNYGLRRLVLLGSVPQVSDWSFPYGGEYRVYVADPAEYELAIRSAVKNWQYYGSFLDPSTDGAPRLREIEAAKSSELRDLVLYRYL